PAPGPAVRHRGHLRAGRRHHPLGRPDQHAHAVAPDGGLLRGGHRDRQHPHQTAGGAIGAGRRVTAAADAYPFTLDDFQRRAIAALDAGESVMVAAPTGSGKTVIAEHAVAKALEQRAKAFYTTPIKALSNQKYADLARRHGAANVGLLTGDNSINGDAPVVVMTTEVLRNMIYAG